jgi:transposase-like protein
MTPDKSAECARLLSEGKRPAEVARQVGVQETTLRKAIRRQGVPPLAPLPQDTGELEAASTKSERSRADAEAAAGMGTACTRADERPERAANQPTIRHRLHARRRADPNGAGIGDRCDDALRSASRCGDGRAVGRPAGLAGACAAGLMMNVASCSCGLSSRMNPRT